MFLAPLLNFLKVAEKCFVVLKKWEVLRFCSEVEVADDALLFLMMMEKSFAICCKSFLCYSRGGMLLSG